MEGLTLRHVGRRAPALRDLSLRWAPGERLLLLGPSGSGKSTLTLCLNGVIPHSLEAHWEAGRVLLDGQDTRRADPGHLAGRVGVLFQDPETQLVMLEVDDEIAFGLECLGVPPEEMRRRVAAARRRSGSSGGRTPSRLDALSGGAKQRVTLAAVLAMGPQALVADEPTANLDPAGARLALRLLGAAAQGRSLLLVEHRLDDLGGLIDRVAVLDGQGHLALDRSAGTRLRRRRGPPGRPRRLDAPVRHPGPAPGRPQTPCPSLRRRRRPPRGPLAGAGAPGRRQPLRPRGGPQVTPAGAPVLTLDGVSYRYPGATPSRTPEGSGRGRLSLEVRGGDFLALVGPNGAGKSTLGLLLAGVLRPTAGRVLLDGRDLAAHDERAVRRRLAYVFQYPEHQFAGRTVREDVLVGLRRLGVEPDEAGRRAAEALERFGLAALAEASPYLLSHGQKRRLSVATALVLRPEVLILDEPTFGQDKRHAEETLDLLSALHREGRTVVVITHDMTLVAERAQRVVALAAGRVVFDGGPRDLFRRRGRPAPLRPAPPTGRGGLRPRPAPAPRPPPADLPPGRGGGAARVHRGAPLIPSKPYLWRRNPTVKFTTVLLLSLCLVLVIDPLTPCLFLALTLLAGVALGRIAPGAYARALAPLLLVGLGFVLTNALFAAPPAGGRTARRRGAAPLAWGPLRLTLPGLLFGLAIGLRGLAIGALSVTFVLTTDPTDLVVSLIQHGRLPFRIGYALLAGYRFLPFFAQEVEQVRLAQRVRGLVQSASPRARLGASLGAVLPLGSSALRRAARVAVAMDSRGFAATRRRTYFRDVPLDWRDGLFLVGSGAVAAGLLALGAAGGWLRLWDGRFSA